MTVPGLLAALARFAAEFGRPDLVGAARWLTDHPPAAAAAGNPGYPGWPAGQVSPPRAA